MKVYSFHSNEVYSSVLYLKSREVKLIVCKIIAFATFNEMSYISFQNIAIVALKFSELRCFL